MTASQLKDVPLSSLMEQVLPFRSDKTIRGLVASFVVSFAGLFARPFVRLFTLLLIVRALARFHLVSRPPAGVVAVQRSRSHDNHRVRGRGTSFKGTRGNSRPCRGRDNQRGNQWDAPREKKGQPELWAAVERSDKVAVQRLLNEGADPEEKFEGWTPLMKASEEGSVDIARLLLEKNADMEATNKKGRTALSFAAAPSMNGTKPRATAVEVLRLLLTSGADAAKQDDRGMTARARAEKEKREDAIAVFNVHGATA